ncbi:hypothetical protein [Spongiimicrobium salis]|uniref:hypothetical protein n=1 Tax=Spongiimicrobium salis TaxID=1667022 RepID=UPI00374DD34E
MKFIKLLACIGVLIAMSSCNFTEEIYVEEDGSGKISLKFDGSQLLETMNEMGAPSSDEFEKPIDSIMSFKEIFDEKRDSISKLPQEEQDKLKKLENFKMHMVMNPDEKLMKFDLFSDFKSVNDIGNVLNDFQNASAITSTQTVNGQSKSPVKSQKPTSEVTYSFSNNTFSRKVTITDQEAFQKSLEESKQTETFLTGSIYTFRYHFPRKVKSTTAKDATFTVDGKTMVYQVSFLEMLKDPESISFEVELED